MTRRIRVLDQSQFHFAALHGAGILAESGQNFGPQIGTFQQSESAIFAEAGIGSSEQFGRLVLNLRQRRGVSLFGVALEHIVHPQCGNYCTSYAINDHESSKRMSLLLPRLIRVVKFRRASPEGKPFEFRYWQSP